MLLFEHIPEVITLNGRLTTGPKGRKIIARGEAPGRKAKGNQPRRGDTKGRIIGLKRLLFSQNVVLLRLRKQIILPPYRMVLPLQGALPPAISCRPFRPNFEIPIHLNNARGGFLCSHVGTRGTVSLHQIAPKLNTELTIS